MALTNQQKQSAVLGAMAVVGILYVYYSFFLKPVNEKIATLDNELSQVTRKIDDMKLIADRLPILQKEYDALLAEVSKTEKRLPRDKKMEDIWRTVSEIAIKNQVSVMSFSPGAEQQSSPFFSEIPFSLSITGQFHSVARFLAAMGQQERIFNARALQLNYAPNTKKNHTVTGSFTLLTYIYKG